MKEKEYYDEIKELIENKEVNARVRAMQDNSDTLNTYWNIGRLIVEAQGGKTRAKYGNELIKKWSIEYTRDYGNGYDATNLRKFRQFFTLFPKCAAVRRELTWTHYKSIITIKNENERNYYINQCVLNNLSSRELIKEIKNKAFDRLSYADKENIKLIESDNYTLTIKDMIKDPIIIEVKDTDKLDEAALHKYIINMLENRFLELGVGFTLAGHEYKIRVGNHDYSLDLLFFNYELNCFVVMELKLRAMNAADIDQTNRYVKLVDAYVKKPLHNKTIGVIIAKDKDKWMIKYATDNEVLATTYKLKDKTLAI